MNDPWNNEQAPEQVVATQAQAPTPVEPVEPVQAPVEPVEPTVEPVDETVDATVEPAEQRQASLALLHLIGGGVSMADAKAQLGERAYD